MKEYISKDYIYSILNPNICDSRGAEHYAFSFMKREIDYAPDAEKVHFGVATWIPVKVPTGVEAFGFKETTVCALKCSECGGEIDVSEGHFRFCPYCGKIMTEENYDGRD